MTDQTAQLDDLDKQLLQVIQRSIPFVPRPFQQIGKALGIDEQQVIDRLITLRDDKKVIRQISAIFDTQSLGYKSSLVAARYPADRLEQAAAIISDHPGVSHNYQRDNKFNLWYTLAVGPDSRLDLQQTADHLHEMTGAESTRLLPTLKLYKIGVQFNYDKTMNQSQAAYTHASRTEAAEHTLSEQDRRVVCVAQQDLPLVAEPFNDWAEQIGCDLPTFLERLQRFHDRKQMRRFAAVLHHRTAGFTANAMTVWLGDEDRIDELGTQLAGFQAVSHCYRRPSYDDWPYNLYTMVHAQSEEENKQILEEMQQETGIEQYEPLWTIREFKKIRLQYFTGDILEWENQHG